MQGKLHTYLTENRLCLFGIALIWIFFRHTFFYNSFSFGVFDSLVRIGDIGVDIFMFLSAYGLSCSYQKNRDKRRYFKRRLFRILPGVILLLFSFAIVDTVIFGAKPYQCIHPRYWFDSLYSTYWFIGAIVLFYIVFPFLFDLLEKVKLQTPFIVLTSFLLSVILVYLILQIHSNRLYQLVVYFARIPILLIGIMMATRGFWKSPIVLVCLIIAIPLIYTLPKDYQRISYSLLTIPIVTYLPVLLNKIHVIIKKPFEFVGVCSLEFYLIHIYLLKNNSLGIVDGFVHSEIITSLVVLAVVILAAVLSNRIIGFLSEHILQKRC